MGSQNPLLYGYQGCRGPGSLPGWLTSTITYQVCSFSGGTSFWGREQELAQLPLCLLNHPISQPCRTLLDPSSYLPGIDGTGTNVSPVQPFTRSLPLWASTSHLDSFPPAPEHSPWPKQWHPSPDPVDVSPLSRTTSKATPEGPPSSKWQDMTSLKKALTPSLLEAFNRDSSLVREMREEYFKTHCPNFSTENTHDLSDIFWCMAKMAKLLSSNIYEIKEVWAGPDELQQANYTLRTLPKGLKFLRAVSPSNSPKVMDLMGIQDLDALCHFYCPWWGKEGQNEGTVVNHLWMVHYRLDLVCKKCYGCPSTSSKTLHHHGQKDCQPSGEEGADESSSSA